MVELIEIDPHAGKCIWKNPNPQSRCKIGDQAGCLDPSGYRRVMLDKVSYKNHILIWFYVHKQWPENLIDHIDGNPTNDGIANLRPATASQNQQNNHRRKGVSGIKGVSPRHGKWVARITIDGKTEHLGIFPSKEEAGAAYAESAKVLFGEYACVV